MQVLRNMTWSNMVATVAEGIGQQQLYRKRKGYFNPHKLYTYDQSLEVCKPSRRKRGDTDKKSEPPSKRGKDSEQKDRKERETKSRRQAGGPEKVFKNAKKQAGAKASDGDQVVDGPRSCATCHKNGRRWRHPGATCWLKPGGKLHGKTNEEVKEFYRKMRSDSDSGDSDTDTNPNGKTCDVCGSRKHLRKECPRAKRGLTPKGRADKDTDTAKS